MFFRHCIVCASSIYGFRLPLWYLQALHSKFRKIYFPQLFGHLFWVGAHGVQCHFSVISWRKVLLVGDTRLPGESHRPAAIHLKSLSYNSVSSTPRHDRDSNLQVVIGTYCIGGYESNYHTIPTMMAPNVLGNTPSI